MKTPGRRPSARRSMSASPDASASSVEPTRAESMPSDSGAAPSSPPLAVASMVSSISTVNSEPHTAATLSSSSEAGGSRSKREVMSASTDGGKSIWSSRTSSSHWRPSHLMSPSSRIDSANSIAKSGLPAERSITSRATSAGTDSTSSVMSSSCSTSMAMSPPSSLRLPAASNARPSGGSLISAPGRIVTSSSSGLSSRRAASSSFHEEESIQCTSSKTRMVREEASFARSTRTISQMASLRRISPVRCFVTSLSGSPSGSTALSSGASSSTRGELSSPSSACGRMQTCPSSTELPAQPSACGGSV
mmetsp:Transcript_2906/g.9836  ORF Transcript_2906/g.9836 Transcript_2906/m.9836 type:complete len:306 (-) Transcript_2906:4649-5566(-)